MTSRFISSDIAPGGRPGSLLPTPTIAGIGLAVVAILLITLFTYRSLRVREESVRRITETMEVLQQLEMTLSSVQDAETGQRGFLLTGEDRYLDPYTTAKGALPGELARLRALLVDEETQQPRLTALDGLVKQKLDELAETITAKRSADSRRAALAIVYTDRGKVVMDRIRSTIAEMESETRRSLSNREAEWQDALGLSTGITWEDPSSSSS